VRAKAVTATSGLSRGCGHWSAGGLCYDGGPVIFLHDRFSFAIKCAKFGSRGQRTKSPRKTTGVPMRASLSIIVTTLALVGTAPPVVAQTGPAPIVKVEGLRQISAQNRAASAAKPHRLDYICCERIRTLSSAAR
jgi:hypothetical protein